MRCLPTPHLRIESHENHFFRCNQQFVEHCALNSFEDSTNGHHQMVNTKIRLIIFFAAKDGEALQSAKTRQGADCGSELLIAKFRLKLKKVEKTTRPFMYDLNQILYDYTVEVRNRFKGLDLIECLMNYGQRFMTLYRRQESRLSSRKKKMQRSKMAV